MDLAATVAELDWYHTLELAPGVVTRGWQDTRDVDIPFGDLTGKRCLDVGTFDGAWAFAMERRGGDVTAIDILDPEQWDWPALSDDAVRETIGARKALGRGFEVAAEALGSKVDRLDCSVYDLDPDVHGRFDVIYVGSLLIHLRDPVRALERVREVCAERLILCDGIDLTLTLAHPTRPVATLDGRGRPWWWHLNQAGMRQVVEAAGFDVVSGPDRIYIPAGEAQPIARFKPKLLASREGRKGLVHAWRGDPHAVIVALPRATPRETASPAAG
jgi:tRNA (mo5U34)-methyltransferase